MIAPAANPPPERFFLSQDGDCHWFIVPVAKRDEWYEWKEIDGDDERSWVPPDFAVPVGGSPSMISFADPRGDN